MVDDPVAGEVDGAVATVTLTRPEQRNTVTYPMLDALLAAFDRLDADDTVRAPSW